MLNGLSELPTLEPTIEPSVSISPTTEPTMSISPTLEPTTSKTPTTESTPSPTLQTSLEPTSNQSLEPTGTLNKETSSITPTFQPSLSPNMNISPSPTVFGKTYVSMPSNIPSLGPISKGILQNSPTCEPTFAPTVNLIAPTLQPFIKPVIYDSINKNNGSKSLNIEVQAAIGISAALVFLLIGLCVYYQTKQEIKKAILKTRAYTKSDAAESSQSSDEMEYSYDILYGQNSARLNIEDGNLSSRTLSDAKSLYSTSDMYSLHDKNSYLSMGNPLAENSTFAGAFTSLHPSIKPPPPPLVTKSIQITDRTDDI